MKMTLTIELTPEQEAVLQQQAQAAGMEASDYAQQLLVSDLVGERMPPTNGAEMLAYLQRTGVFGLFADRGDSQEFARQLRERANQPSTVESDAT